MLPATSSSRRFATLLIGLAFSFATPALLQAQSSTHAPSTAPDTATSTPTKSTQAAHRATRRRRRAVTQQSASQTVPASTANVRVGPTAAQRSRDAQILAAQRAQSAETARENTAVTQQAVRTQQQQQAEPRIQDAPGPGAQPLAGDPAVQTSQPADPPRIQDAPGPAQTLPKTPPQPAPQP